MSRDRLWFDQALRDVTMITKETPWDVGRRLGGLLIHVWAEKHDPQLCTTCAKAEAYVTVFRGGLQIDDRDVP